MEILGIDIGGSALKGAPVNLEQGKLTTERIRIEMPVRSTPDAVGDCVAELIRRFDWQGPVGCTFPAIVKHGKTLSAANVDKAWVDFKAEKMLEKKTHRPVCLVNDADAAGMAEMEFGAGRGQLGVVIMLTFGTGIGSAIFTHGVLLPNA